MGEKPDQEMKVDSTKWSVPIDSDLSISVIVPVYNGETTLARCLQSIQNAKGPVKEIIVVDDASTDRSAQIAIRFGCRVLSNEEVLGAARSRNIGARSAEGTILFFTDSDIEVPCRCFDRIVEFMQKNDVTAAIGILSETTESKNFASKYENYYMYRQYAIHSDQIAILYTSVAAIFKDVFTEVGGFDRNYSGATIEDMELGQRLIISGYRILIDKKTKVHHLKRFSVLKLFKANFRKASGTIKIKLRNISAGIKTPALVAPPLSFIAGIPLTVFSFIIGLAGIWFHCLLPVSAIFIVSVFILNAGWIKYLFDREGFVFAAAGVVFMMINYLVYAAGIFFGVLTFGFGKQY